MWFSISRRQRLGFGHSAHRQCPSVLSSRDSTSRGHRWVARLLTMRTPWLRSLLSSEDWRFHPHWSTLDLRLTETSPRMNYRGITLDEVIPMVLHYRADMSVWPYAQCDLIESNRCKGLMMSAARTRCSYRKVNARVTPQSDRGPNSKHSRRTQK